MSFDDFQWLVTMVIEGGFAVQAYRLVKALGAKVQAGETRTDGLEKRVDNHEVRIVKLEFPIIGRS